MAKPQQQDDPVWSILPSYQMYQQFLYDPLDTPPQYGDTHSTHSSAQISTLPSSNDSTMASTAPSSVSVAPTTATAQAPATGLIVADESTTSWRETILDNIHRLRNISSSDNPYTTNVDISVHFTQDVGRSGVEPVHIDPSNFEYKQGDFINGYVYIKNNGPKPLPFDVFYVLFEGNYTFKSETSETTKKFLEMYDFAASWNEASVNRLLCEPDRQYPEGLVGIDSRDGAHTCMRDRVLKPGVLYKRYFTFKIPEKLLDSECSDHSLPSHSGLPPTLGLSKLEKDHWKKEKAPICDFSFINTATSYGVLARFIGKASTFSLAEDRALKTKLINNTGDEFIIFKEDVSFIRIVQESTMFSEPEAAVNKKASALLLDNIRSQLATHLEWGTKQVAARKESPNSEIVHSAEPIGSGLAAQKIAQLYTQLSEPIKNRKPDAKPAEYTIAIPAEKRSLLNSPKLLGTLMVSTPKTEYVLGYMSPKRFSAQEKPNADLWKMDIPIRVAFQPVPTFKGIKAPEITSVVPELVVFTSKSESTRFPVEFTHDMLFRNSATKLGDSSTDTFENIVQAPLKKTLQNLKNVITTLGVDNINIERSLWRDARTIVMADVKKNNLALMGVMLETHSGTHEAGQNMSLPLEKKNGEYVSNMTVKVDASKAYKKGAQKSLPANYSAVDSFCLVPTFQTCHLVRMYYLKLKITFSTKDTLELKVPVTIAKFTSN